MPAVGIRLHAVGDKQLVDDARAPSVVIREARQRDAFLDRLLNERVAFDQLARSTSLRMLQAKRSSARQRASAKQGCSRTCQRSFIQYVPYVPYDRDGRNGKSSIPIRVSKRNPRGAFATPGVMPAGFQMRTSYGGSAPPSSQPRFEALCAQQAALRRRLESPAAPGAWSLARFEFRRFRLLLIFPDAAKAVGSPLHGRRGPRQGASHLAVPAPLRTGDDKVLVVGGGERAGVCSTHRPPTARP